jgi:hypothetical protein
VTAVIGILNKSAVAIAADSAVTFGQTQKILNTANKLFTLSKHHPVGIVIYNSASFVSIPWEVLIKEYRRSRGTAYKDTLSEYAADFVRYAKDSIGLISDARRKEEVYHSASKFFQELSDEIRKKVGDAFQQLTATERNAEKVHELASSALSDGVASRNHRYTAPEVAFIDDAALQSYSLDDFLATYDEPLQRTWSQILGQYNPEESIKELAFSTLHKYLQSEDFTWSNWSGIGIIGYGDKEIYPSCHMLHFAEVVDGHVRVKTAVKESSQISDENPSAILPFAQRDVIEGFLTGVRPDLAAVYNQVFEQFANALSTDIENKINALSAQLPPEYSLQAPQLNVPQLVANFVQQMQDVQEQGIFSPMRQSVMTLSKEDLAEMAESLIHLTYLHRRINSAPESVGGPIDVAVISKGDGFIWMKRKFYFRPELNPGFVQNYFSEERPA